MLCATGRVVAFTDADLPFDLGAAERIRVDSVRTVPSGFWGPGYRTIRKIAPRRLVRRIATFMFREIVSRLVSREVTDTQCGLKLFSRRAALELFSRTTIDGFAFDAEVVLLTHLLKLPFRRIPVTLVNEYGSTISLRRHALPMLLEVLRTWLRARRGKYSLEPAIRQPTLRAPSRGRRDSMGRLAPATRYKIALAAWAVFAVGLAVNACVNPSRHTNYSPCFESGTRAWWNNQNMYDHHVVPDDFRYGPLFAVAMTPLAELPTWLGGMLWNWLNLGLFFWSAPRWPAACFRVVGLCPGKRLFCCCCCWAPPGRSGRLRAIR